MFPAPDLSAAACDGDIVVESVVVLLIVPVSRPKSDEFPHRGPVLGAEVGWRPVSLFPWFPSELLPEPTLCCLEDHFPLPRHPARWDGGVTLLLYVLDALVPNQFPQVFVVSCPH